MRPPARPGAEGIEMHADSVGDAPGDVQLRAKRGDEDVALQS